MAVSRCAGLSRAATDSPCSPRRLHYCLQEGWWGVRRGVCIFVNVWWGDVQTVHKHCLPEVELLLLKCRPFYLPGEFSAVFLAAKTMRLLSCSTWFTSWCYQRSENRTPWCCFHFRGRLQPLQSTGCATKILPACEYLHKRQEYARSCMQQHPRYWEHYAASHKRILL